MGPDSSRSGTPKIWPNSGSAAGTVAPMRQKSENCSTSRPRSAWRRGTN